jgi:hypothetical protein
MPKSKKVPQEKTEVPSSPTTSRRPWVEKWGTIKFI